jgi:predicted DNA-binding transcriptional regulator AlpA
MQKSPGAPSSEPPPAANGRYAVPRELGELPDALHQKWIAAGGSGQRDELRKLYRREFRRAMDVCLSVDAAGAGALFGLGERAWRRLDTKELVPRPLKIGRASRWRLSELAAWVKAGCPDRETWEAR